MIVLRGVWLTDDSAASVVLIFLVDLYRFSRHFWVRDAVKKSYISLIIIVISFIEY